MKPHVSSHRKQQGAALVIGLVLLTILTLLAITGMNTSTTELIMAGNEQYRQKAFLAAETGRENVLLRLPSLPTDTIKRTAPEKTVATGAPETYITTAQFLGVDGDIAGYRVGTFVGNHYRITASGKSSRNAVANQEQGAFVIAPGGGGTSGDAGAPLPGTNGAL